MKQLILNIFLYLLFSTTLFAQDNKVIVDNDSIIVWNKDRLLSYNDFNGKIDSSNINNYDGFAHCGLRVLPKYDEASDKYIIEVKALFDRNKSSLKVKNEDILKHEQLHFDIVELYARKIRKQYDSLSQKNIYKNDLYHNIYLKLNEEKNKCQKLYDYETAHSIVVEEQKRWEEKVSKELKELEDYSNPYLDWNAK